MILNTQSAEIYYEIIGKGEPLLLVHGGPGLTHDYLRPQIDILAERNQLIFYDQRACGKSTGEINDATMRTNIFVEDLEAIRKALGIDRVSILGHSWGGFLSMNYAIAHSDKIKKLIIANALPFSKDEHTQFQKEVAHRIEPIHNELNCIAKSELFLKYDPEVVEKYYRDIFRVYFYNKKEADKLNLTMTQTATEHLIKIHKLFVENVFSNPYDLYSQLKELNLDCLVIHGDTDPIPASSAENIHKNLANSSYHLIKECGHFPYIEKRVEFAKVIQAFLEK